MDDRLNTHGTKPEWRTKLQTMTDDELLRHCEKFIWLSAYANNNPRSDYHFLCDAGYVECVRRNRRDSYDEAYKEASAQ